MGDSPVRTVEAVIMYPFHGPSGTEKRVIVPRLSASRRYAETASRKGGADLLSRSQIKITLLSQGGVLFSNQGVKKRSVNQ